ncbi:MAG: LysR substrate-binding domain-containing protein [Paracoccaceae bacterium]
MRHVQLRAFHFVALHGGFTRAAEELHVTQPAISDQIRKLEEEYDVLLFNRNKRLVTLTTAGRELLDITRRLFDAQGQALELLSESRAMRAGNLRIVADSASHLLHILTAFRVKYPGVRISVRSGNTQSVVDSLHSYEADLGVLGEIPAGAEFEHVRLNATPITAFVAVTHPLASRKSLRFQDIAGLPLVLREPGSKTRAKLEDAALAAGVALTAVIEAEGREAVREIVASGAGIGFVSMAEFGADARLVAIPIVGAPAMVMEEALICLRERRSGKLVRAFLEMARTLAL